MPTLFYSLTNNPDEWSNNDANDNNINSYLFLSAYSAPRHYVIFLHILPDLIVTKSKEEKTFNILISKIVKLNRRAGIHTQECI